MSSTTDSDPYIQFQSDVQQLLQTTRTTFSSYLRIQSLSPSPNNPELQSTLSELRSDLSDLSQNLDDLSLAVTAVEKDPYKFGLDIPEVRSRRRFVEEVRGEVEDMNDVLNKPPPTSGTGRDVYRDEEMQGGSYNDPVAAYEQEQQLEMMREQDETLEGVYRTVGNLRSQADEMGRELGEQEEMIGALDTDVERVEGKLSKGVKDLNIFIRKNEDTASNWCIGLLVLVLCVLLFLLIII